MLLQLTTQARRPRASSDPAHLPQDSPEPPRHRASSPAMSDGSQEDAVPAAPPAVVYAVANDGSMSTAPNDNGDITRRRRGARGVVTGSDVLVEDRTAVDKAEPHVSADNDEYDAQILVDDAQPPLRQGSDIADPADAPSRVAGASQTSNVTCTDDSVPSLCLEATPLQSGLAGRPRPATSRLTPAAKSRARRPRPSSAQVHSPTSRRREAVAARRHGRTRVRELQGGNARARSLSHGQLPTPEVYPHTPAVGAEPSLLGALLGCYAARSIHPLRH